MNVIENLAKEKEVVMNYIVETHRQWHEGNIVWITGIYEGLKELSPGELLEALNKEVSL